MDKINGSGSDLLVYSSDGETIEFKGIDDLLEKVDFDADKLEDVYDSLADDNIDLLKHDRSIRTKLRFVQIGIVLLTSRRRNVKFEICVCKMHTVI